MAKGNTRDSVRLRLTITVNYDLNGCSVAEVEERLCMAAEHLAQEGLLSGETEATVTEWEKEVTEVA